MLSSTDYFFLVTGVTDLLAEELGLILRGEYLEAAFPTDDGSDFKFALAIDYYKLANFGSSNEFYGELKSCYFLGVFFG